MSAVRISDRKAADRPGMRLRPPSEVMRLARLGAFHQTRLSFSRVLLRRAAGDDWQFDRPIWRIDEHGEGVAVYRVRTAGHVYSLVAFAHDLPSELRSDRVIAEAWDATFALHDGAVSEADIERLSRNVPRQEAGRMSARELTLSRANRSVRLFDEVVETLAAGRQPSPASLDAVGYLMRTTAVYGSGKFGLSDRERIADRPEFAGPFGAEMLTVWLIRTFTTDLVEHLAACRAPRQAVRLEPALKRRLGVGNSTGLGMAPFIVHHAGLLHRWIHARETALARVLALPVIDTEAEADFRRELGNAIGDVAGWSVPDAVQAARNADLLADLERIEKQAALGLAGPFPWRGLFDFAVAHLGVEAQEMLVTLLLEPHGPLVDELAGDMGGDESEERRIDGSATLSQLRAILDDDYDFARAADAADADALFWYVSEEKLEPRLGLRAEDDGAEREQPLAIARDAAGLAQLLAEADPDDSVADFLVRHPDMRHMVRRAQLAHRRAYAEIRDNLIDATMRPIDLLRCKLSFFGATRFDPKSDRWVRISLFVKAPFPDEICAPFVADGPSAEPLRLPAGSEETIVLSLNEIDAALRKAARGAGLAWGEAEEIGRAARWAAAVGLDALPFFADVLEAHLAGALGRLDLAGEIWHGADDRPASPLILGIALLDRVSAFACGNRVLSGPVACPALVLPFLAEVAQRLGRVVRVGIDDRCILVRPGSFGVEAATLGMEPAVRMTITVDPSACADDGDAQPPFAGHPTSLPAWERIDRLAMRTTVPASAKSRLKGAGSGAAGAEND